MGDQRPFSRRHSDRRGRNQRGEISIGDAAVLGFLIIAVSFAAANSEKMPAPVGEAVTAYRNLGREHAPPAGAFYYNCDDARAAGVAPIYVGEPGYRDELDGDGDGIACEPYHGR